MERLQLYEGASGQVVEVHQGSEPAEFWQSIGGQGPITTVSQYDLDYEQQQ